MADDKKKEKMRAIIAAAKKRKQVHGRVNIENVSSPKKHKPKKIKQQKKKKVAPAQVSIGTHGGRYIQEPSGHKRYVAEGKLSGVKRFKKSIKEQLELLIKGEIIASSIEEFIKRYKEKK
jgi:hypothetical protein